MTSTDAPPAPASAAGTSKARIGAPLALLATAALVTVLIAAGLGGAVTAYVVGDPGAVVRWGLPIVRVIHDLAAAVTIGLLTLAAFLMPETTRTHRRVTATRIAAVAAVVWALAGLVHVLLTFADLAGMPLTDPSFATQAQAFLWELDPTRTALIASLCVAVVAIFAFLVTTKTGMAWLAALSVFSLLPLALVGHSASSRDHMGGINAIAVHMIAACIWVGGLVGLAIMRGPLGTHLAVTARRYSSMAAWAFTALLASGVLATYINLAEWDDLISWYGAIIVVKAGALALLGLAGLVHRRRTLAKLDSDPTSRSLFARLLVGEVALMGVAFGAAAALSRTPSPGEAKLEAPASLVYDLTGYPDPGPPPSNAWLVSWTIDWLWLPVALVAIGVYWHWALRLRRRGDDWPVLRTVSWTIGWLVFIYFTSGAPGTYGKVLFSWHMIMHMGIAMIAPIFMVLGAPMLLALRALPARPDKTLGPREFLLGLVHSRYLKVVANPAFAAAMFFFSMAIFYFTPWFEFSMTTHTGHTLMIVHFLMSGYFFVWTLIGIDPGPQRWSPLALMIVLFVTISFHAFFGVVLTSLDTVLAPGFFNVIDLSWPVDPLRDQVIGGQIAWGVGEVPTLTLALILAIQWVRTDDKEARRRDRQADRDHDAELNAYNEYLGKLRQATDRYEGAERRDEP